VSSGNGIGPGYNIEKLKEALVPREVEGNVTVVNHAKETKDLPCDTPILEK